MEKNEKKPEKTLSQRLESLVTELEKSTGIIKSRFSYKAAFLRGIAQGLGVVIGSTIIAGIAYTLVTQFISPKIIHDISIDAVVEQQK